MSLIDLIDEPKILIPVSALDKGLSLTVSPRAFHLYIHLRRFIWRKVDCPFGFALYGEGHLAAKVGQKLLGARIGCKSRQVQNLVCELERVGWLSITRWGKEEVYILGRWVELDGQRIEIYYMNTRVGEERDPPPPPAIIMTPHGARIRFPQAQKIAPVKDFHRRKKLQKKESLFSTDSQSSAEDSSYGQEPLIYKIKEEKKRIKEKKKVPEAQTSAHKPSVVPSSWKSKSEEKPLSQKKEKTNAHTLKTHFAALWRASTGGPIPAFTGRDLAHLAEFARAWGSGAQKFLSFAFKSWSKVSSHLGIKGLPTVVNLYTHREAIYLLTISKDPWSNDNTKSEKYKQEGW